MGLHGSGFFPSLGCFPDEVEGKRETETLQINVERQRKRAAILPVIAKRRRREDLTDLL